MKNRRNYYRLLHVQPDAPLAIIQSSYRALMLKLRQHPDLGGDHQTAALINEAHAVLTDPAKRAAYDEYLRRRRSTGDSGHAPFQRRPSAEQPRRNQDVRCPDRSRCPFCDAPYSGTASPGARCAQCDSPLCPPMPMKLQWDDQRAVQRFAHDGEITLLAQRVLKMSKGTIRDLSPTGLCCTSDTPLAVGQVVKIDGSVLCAVARVISCGKRTSSAQPSPLLGVEFLTVEFATAQGTFIQTLA
jgi:hypothetical protein